MSARVYKLLLANQTFSLVLFRGCCILHGLKLILLLPQTDSNSFISSHSFFFRVLTWPVICVVAVCWLAEGKRQQQQQWPQTHMQFCALKFHTEFACLFVCWLGSVGLVECFFGFSGFRTLTFFFVYSWESSFWLAAFTV